MIELQVMGGWLKAGDVDVHSIDCGIWEGLIVGLPLSRTYVQVKQVADLGFAIDDKWHFLVFDEQRLLPDRFTEGDLEYVKLQTILGQAVLETTQHK